MKRKPIVVLLALLLAFTTVIFAACGSTATATLSVKDGFFAVDEATGVYSKVVDSDVTEVDVLANVEVNDGFTLSLYSDKELTKKVDKAEINDGINTFYIKAEPTGKGEAKTFVVKITRSQEYTIKFVDGDEVVREIKVKAGSKISEADVTAPVKPGYTFAGWGDFDFDKAPTASATVEARYVANTDTAYKVEHYKKAHGGNYVLGETENKTGTTDTTVNASPKAYDGYKFNAKASTMSGTIAGDGSLVLKAYYDEEAVTGKVTVYVENVNNDEYALDDSASTTFEQYNGETYTYDTAAPAGYTIDAAKSTLSVTVNAADPASNVVKVYLKRVRAEVTFKKGDVTVATKTAKYGFGLITAEGALDAAPAITDTPAAGKEFVWATAEGEEVDYDRITGNVTLVQTERTISRKIQFAGVNVDADYDADGYEITLPEKESFASGEEVVFYLDVNEDFNKSEVVFIYKKKGETGAGTILAGTLDKATGRYTYRFTPDASGTVEMQGAFEVNSYDVTAVIVPFGEWGTISSFEGVTAELDDGSGVVTPVTIGADGTIGAKLEKGEYTITVTGPVGAPVAVDFEIATEDGWDNKLVPGYDFGEIVIGLHEVNTNMVANSDGSIDSNPRSEDRAYFKNLNAKEYAVKATVEFVGGTEGDPGFVYELYNGDNNLYLALMRNKLRVFGSGFDWSGDRVDITHGIGGLWEVGQPFEYRLVKSGNAIILYYQKADDAKPVAFATVADGKVNMLTTGETTTLSTKATARINEILASSNTVSFKSSVNIDGGASLNVTYTGYGYLTDGYGATVTLPETIEGGAITATANGAAITDKAPLGSSVVVNVTPDEGKEITTFTVKVNGGSEVSVADSNLGTVTGGIEGYTLTFVPMNWDMTYEFNATFKEKDPQSVANGKIVDKDNGTAAVAGATVAYYLLDESGARTVKFAETTTDENGAYSVSLKSGKYEVEVSGKNYFTRTVTDVQFTVGDAAQDVDDIALKFMTVGGTTVIGDKEFESNAAYNVTYDYATDAITASTGISKNMGSKRVYFSGVTSNYAVFKYSVSLGDMSSVEGGKEFWPGLGLMIVNGNGQSREYRILRNGVWGDGVQENLYHISNKIDFSGNVTDKSYDNITPSNKGDIMIVKEGNKIHMFAKIEGMTKYEYFYTFDVMNDGERVWRDTTLAYSISLGANQNYVDVSWSNFSVATGEEAVNAALEGYTTNPFTMGVQYDEKNADFKQYQGGIAGDPDGANGEFRFVGNNATRALDPNNKYNDFIVEAEFTTAKYFGLSKDEVENWNSFGFAIGTDKDNTITVARCGKGLRLWNYWNTEFAKGDNFSALATDAKIVDPYMANGGQSNFAANRTVKFKMIRKGTALYLVGDGVYMGKIAVEDGVTNFYYADGTKAEGYSFTTRTNNDPAVAMNNIMNSDQVMVGVGMHGNNCYGRSTVKNYTITSEGVDAAVAAIDAAVKNTITVTDGEGGASAITVDGAEYVQDTTVAYYKPVVVTFTPNYNDESKYVVKSVSLSINGGDAQDVTSDLGSVTGSVAKTYSFTAKYATNYAFTVEYELQGKVASVSGNIVDVDATATKIAGATVKAINAENVEIASATTDENGAFTLTGLAAGAYTLTVSKNNYYTRTGYAFTVEAADYDAVETIASAVGIKYMAHGGSVTIGEKTLTSNLKGINTTYDYTTGTEKTFTPRGEKAVDAPGHWFSDYTSENAVVEYTVKFDPMTDVDDTKEWWPGISVRMHNGTSSFEARFLRFGVVDWTRGGNIQTGPGDLVGDAWGYAQANMTGEYGENSVDVRVIKSGSRVYMFSKYSKVTGWTLVYSYNLSDAFVGKQLAFGIDIAANNAAYCYMDWENISISGDATVIANKLAEAGGETPFDYSVALDDLNVVERSGAKTYLSRFSDGWYSFSDGNPQFTYTSGTYHDFIADVKVMNYHDKTFNMPGGGGDDWETTGFALSAGGLNRVLIGANETGMKMYRNGWTETGWAEGSDLSTHNMFSDLGSFYGFTNYSGTDGAIATLRIIRKGDNLYFVRDGKYIARFDKDGKSYAPDGTQRDYKLPSSWTAVMAAEKLAIGVAGFGNHVHSDAVKDFAVVTDTAAIDAAIAKIEGEVKGNITVTDGEGGSSVITVAGAAYTAGTTVTAAKQVKVTVTANAGYAISKFEMKVGEGEWQEESIDGGVYTFTAKYNTNYQFRTTFAVANTVNGTVTESAGGGAIEGATVALLNGDISVATATTDAEGKYSFAAVAEGTYSLKITSGKHYARVYENAVTVAAGDPITAPEAQLDASVFGGDTTFSTGTTVKFSSDLNVDYNYDTKALTVSTVEGKNGGNLQTQNALFTGVKDAYSMVKFTVENKGGTEKDPGMGVRYVDESGNKFQYLTRQNGVRIGEPTWVSSAGSNLTSGFSFANVGIYDVMFVRADKNYYIIAKEHSARDYELIYVSTEETRTAQKIDNTKMPSGEARVSLTFTIGNNITVNYVFTNFGSAQGEDAINAIIGATHTVTINGIENAAVSVTGGTASAENANVYTVPFGTDVTVAVTPDEDYELVTAVCDGDAKFGVTNLKLSRVIADKVVTLTIKKAENKTVSGTLSGFTAPTGIDGAGKNYVVFTRDNGKTYHGEATLGEDAITYTASLPAGNYTKVNWLGFMSDTAIAITADETKDITLDKVEYTNVTSSGLTAEADGSLTTKNENNTHETAFTGVTFNPTKQKLTFCYTLTGMSLGNKEGHYAMPGMFVMDGSGNVMRIVNVNAGDVIMLMAKEDYQSRMYFQSTDSYKPFGIPTDYYTFSKENYKLTMKIVVDGHKIEMYAKVADDTNWRTIYGADSQFDVYDRYANNNCNNGTAGSTYVDTLYGVNKDCRFGISMRRDKADDSVNLAKFSNIWYTIEDRA